VRELKQFVPLLDAIYSDAAPTTPLAADMPRAVLSIEWLMEETLTVCITDENTTFREGKGKKRHKNSGLRKICGCPRRDQ
jgi:hypothetical protein